MIRLLYELLKKYNIKIDVVEDREHEDWLGVGYRRYLYTDKGYLVEDDYGKFYYSPTIVEGTIDLSKNGFNYGVEGLWDAYIIVRSFYAFMDKMELEEFKELVKELEIPKEGTND